MIYGTVLCLGDSLTEGARAPMGWPEMLPELLDVRSVGTEWATLNHGISGQTTLQILRRTPAAVRSLASLPGTKWAVILAGTNDAKNRRPDATETLLWWSRLYEQILHWPRRYPDVNIALCTFPPVSGEMPAFTDANPWLKLASETVRQMASYHNGRTTRDGTSSRVVVVDLEDMPTENLVDGVHLTHDGNRWVARRVADVLLETT